MTALPLTLRWWNLEQTFTQVDAAREASPWPLDSSAGCKAALWDVDGPTLTLTSRRPARVLLAHGLAPEQCYAALPEHGEDERWQDSANGAALMRIVHEAGAVRLAPCVWTRQAEMIARALEKEQVAVEAETPCPHGRVFCWNTRVGMRDLFLSIPALADHLPPSLVCHDAAQVEITAARLGQHDLLVKSNFALGGAGSVMLRAGKPYRRDWVEAIAARASGKGKGKKAFAWAWREEPYVVERVVGSWRTNVSVTLDARQTATGTEIAGLSEQMIEGLAYRGIRSLDSRLEADHRPRLHALTEAVGAGLASRGFAGWFNLDFVLTRAGQCFLADLNVRRSAPLDLHMLVARIQQRSGRMARYRAFEASRTHLADEDAVDRSLEAAGLAFDGATGVLPLRALVAESDRTYSLPVLLLAEDESALDKLAAGLRRAFGS
ncbi:MAG: hypothetical protein RKO66_09450 [Candidatus Contendobacter sp.]|nr:hypothetical protein [Candidatus Contendobacter sp.]